MVVGGGREREEQRTYSRRVKCTPFNQARAILRIELILEPIASAGVVLFAAAFHLSRLLVASALAGWKLERAFLGGRETREAQCDEKSCGSLHHVWHATRLHPPSQLFYLVWE